MASMSMTRFNNNLIYNGDNNDLQPITTNYNGDNNDLQPITTNYNGNNNDLQQITTNYIQLQQITTAIMMITTNYNKLQW